MRKKKIQTQFVLFLYHYNIFVHLPQTLLVPPILCPTLNDGSLFIYIFFFYQPDIKVLFCNREHGLLNNCGL